MAEITAVTFVPKSIRRQLRYVLGNGDTEGLRWQERKRWSGSDFYFSGPAALVMKTHAFVSDWVVGHRPDPKSRFRIRAVRTILVSACVGSLLFGALKIARVIMS